MQTELEAKFLRIDPVKFRQQLRSVGANLVSPERLMRRRNFDFPNGHLEKIAGWVRVRDEGDRITMTYKQLNDRTLHGTKEINLTVSDFEAACKLLQAINLQQTSYQETKRESWELNGVQVEIDTWPWIPTFVELEGETETALMAAATQLGLDWHTAVHGSVEVAYQLEYDVTEAEVDHWPEITFCPIPPDLQSKRRPVSE